MHLVMNPKDPQVSVRLADEGFAPYVWCNDFSFEVRAYARADRHKKVEHWPLDLITPYRKCYGIDPDEFASYRGGKDSDIFMAYLDNQPVGHVVVSTNWNGFAHVDELAVVASARRHGVARSLLEVIKFWSHKKNLPGIMLETQNNNLGACRLYERCGYQVGGIDYLRYRGIDPQTSEVAIFWYLIFESRIQPV